MRIDAHLMRISKNRRMTNPNCDPKRTKKFSKTLSHLTNVVGNDCIYEEKGLLCDEPIRVRVGYIPRP